MTEFRGMQTLVRAGKRHVAATFSACCLFVGLPLLAQVAPVAAQAQVEALQELETVVVTATPQMWKISKGGHVLWLLVFNNAAPAGNEASVSAQWRSEQWEARVAESQLVLYPANVIAPDYEGRLRYEGRSLLLPGKDTLKDVLPEETYARWRILKTAYIGTDDSSEKLRPRAALRVLESEVMKTMPATLPTSWYEFSQLVDHAAKKYKVKTRRMRRVEAMAQLSRAETDMAHLETRLDLDDVRCFTQGMADLERLIRERDQRSNVTMRGARVSPSASCSTDWLASGKLSDVGAAQRAREKVRLQFRQALQQADDEWMAAARDALAKNKSTFAIQHVAWERPGSYIAKFRELGYQVDEPGSVNAEPELQRSPTSAGRPASVPAER